MGFAFWINKPHFISGLINYFHFRINPHSAKPCKPHWFTAHEHAYGNEGNERVNEPSDYACIMYTLYRVAQK